MTYEITLHGTTRVVTVERQKDGRYSVSFDGVTRVVDLLKPTAEAFQMLIDGEGWEAGCVPTREGFLVDIMGASTDVQVVDPRRKALKTGAGAANGTMVTQMPGRVVRLLVAPGTPVKQGQAVLVVEAMKMENEMKSPIDGVLAEFYVTDGQSVETGTKLARVDA